MIWLSFEAGGMRRDEMRLLRKAEYDPATKSLALQADRNKNEEPRVIILNERAAGIVERWSAVSRSEYVFSNPGSSAGGPVPESTLWGWLDAGRKAAAEAGVNVVLAGDAFCIHHARHGFTMRMQGVMPEAWVADQLGHSSTEMIAKRYGRLRGGEAREQARAMLEGRSQPVAPVESR
jgi:integrase